MDDAEWDNMMELNLTTVMRSLRMCSQVWRRNTVKGNFIAIGSMTGFISNGKGFHNSHYAAAKAGVTGLIKAAAIELAPRKIRVNAVCPGPIETPMLEEFRHKNEGLYNEFVDRIPLGLGRPEDVAGACVYLADAPFVTGSCLMVDGGYTAQ